MNATLPPLQPIDLAATSPVAVYFKANAAVCPFVEPAARSGCLSFCELTTDCHTAQDIHPRLFEHMVPIIERFRDARHALEEKQRRLLICHTVLIQMPTQLDADTVKLLTWPNWLAWSLKYLYTPKEIVFGFIRKNIAESSSFGVSIPPPPFHGIIIRSRVVGSDLRFFKGNQPLLDAMMQADDDGQSAHAVVPGEAPDIRDPQALRNADYFHRVRLWGQKTLGMPQQ
jgi:hypothetical protein